MPSWKMLVQAIQFVPKLNVISNFSSNNSSTRLDEVMQMSTKQS